MQSWKVHARSTILAHSKYLTVEDHHIELPDGREIPNWPWVITPDFVNIAVVTTENRYLCFRQTKYAVEGETLAPAGGYLEPGEDPAVAGQRELLEETGYRAPDWLNLGSYAVDGNRGAGTAYLYLARGAYKVQEPVVDDLEEQEMLLLSRAEVQDALEQGKFKVLPWTAVMALALLHT
jgi:ADP-ribose pyrophosphatase